VAYFPAVAQSHRLFHVEPEPFPPRQKHGMEPATHNARAARAAFGTVNLIVQSDTY